MQVRLKVVDGQAAPCGAAAQALEALLRRIEEEQVGLQLGSQMLQAEIECLVVADLPARAAE
jgi:hypothetical protein